VSPKDDVRLTAEEAQGLRELLAFLAVFEERGYDPDKRLYSVTMETWREMTAPAKAKLGRFARPPAVRLRDRP
jgi:hypothetical protein